MKFYSVFLLVTLAMMVMAAAVAAEVPSVISYQGRLTTPTGASVPDGNYTIAFTIYDAAGGGTSKWTETQSVTTSGGLFSVQLGSVTPVSDTVFSGTTRYLGITVGTDSELMPRVALVAVPYAQRVSTVDGATGGTLSGSTAIQNNLNVSGNVGIGTETPLRKLHIGTGTTVNNVFSDVLLNFADGDDHYYEVTNTSGFGLFGMGGSSTNIVGSGNLRFSPGAHTAVTMTSSGYVGVGTADPWDKLHVAGTIRADQFRGPLVVNGGNITYAADGGDHIFSTAVQERMRVTVGGNVGIGTATPDIDAKLNVNGYVFAKAPIVVYDSAKGPLSFDYDISWLGDVRVDSNFVQKQANETEFLFKKQGFYRMSVFCNFNPTYPTAGGSLSIYKNGTLTKDLSDLRTGSAVVQSNGSDLFKIRVHLTQQTTPHSYRYYHQLSIEYLGSD